MDVSKCTPGPWSDEQDADGRSRGYIRCTKKLGGTLGVAVARATSTGISTSEAAANAQLIAEAGTVAHETGLSPRQLAEQRGTLLEAVRLALAIEESTTQGHERELRKGYPDLLRAALAACK